jgi:two-component system response regulator DesR
MSERDDYSLNIGRIVRDVAMGKVVISPRIASRLLQRRRRFYDQFTRREMDLLRLLADGYPVEEIANRLDVAKGTVYNKLMESMASWASVGCSRLCWKRFDGVPSRCEAMKTRPGMFSPALLHTS